MRQILTHFQNQKLNSNYSSMSTIQHLLTVSEAVASRRSCRDFLDKEVPYDLIMKILNESRWAPSSSNLQPWKIYLLHGQNKKKLTKIMQSKLDTGVMIDVPLQFQIHPGVTVPAPGFMNEMKQKYPKHYQRYTLSFIVRIYPFVYIMCPVTNDYVSGIQHWVNSDTRHLE